MFNQIFKAMNEVTKAQSKDEIFTKIYNEQKPLIELYLRTKITNEEVRNDIISETFIKVFQRMEETYKPEMSKITTWIHTIARNTLIDYIRKEKIKNCATTEADLNLHDDEKTFEFKNVSEVTADKQLENNELADRILMAFDKIKPTYREVAIEHFIYEQYYNEIAEKLDIPLNTVKVAILRAREVLQGALKYEYASL